MRFIRWLVIGAAFAACAVNLPSQNAEASTASTYHWGAADLTGTPVVTPTLVSGLPSDIVGYCTGFTGGDKNYNLALDSTGTLYSWGGNGDGVLGNGSTTDDDTPTVVAGLPPVSHIACGGHWVAVVDTFGHIWTWGRGTKGEMADATYNSYSRPHEVPGVSTAAGVAAGGGAAVAFLTDGSVITWGRNNDGELGTGTSNPDANVPVPVPGLTKVIQVSHSWRTVSAIDSSGALWVWGFTGFGQRGDGTSPTVTSTPIQVRLPLPAVEASVGGGFGINGHVLALLNDGSVWAWGNNEKGQVGDGTTGTAVLRPVRVPIAAAVREVGTGAWYSAAVTNKGKVIIWGDNSLGELGDGSTNPSYSDVPVRLTTLPGPVTALGYGPRSLDALA